MDLANLSLAEIASMLNTKQQEVLLASISVAARFIQQFDNQTDIQQFDADQQQQDSNNQLQQQQQQQHFTSQDLTKRRVVMQQHTNQNDYGTDLDDDDDDDDDDSTGEHYDNQMDQHNLHHNHHHQLHQNQLNNNNTAATSTADEQTLLTIREFAEELKHRRKSIRLSQKGAAQSLRAFTAGEQPCTDAIIYHFENLQLEPERAMQLIPLLRDWLEWAEKHRLNGKQLPMLSAVTKVPRERKRKVVLFNEKAKQHLEDAFLKNNHPDRYQLDVISQELNIPTRSIRKWFTNRRQRKRFAEKFSPVI